MKVIDLLNEIHNGYIPTFIKIKGTKLVFGSQHTIERFYLTQENNFEWVKALDISLNDEVELYPGSKEDKEIKTLDKEKDMYDYTFWESEFQTCTDLEKKIIDNICLLRKKQEELIKAVNELKKGK